MSKHSILLRNYCSRRLFIKYFPKKVNLLYIKEEKIARKSRRENREKEKKKRNKNKKEKRKKQGNRWLSKVFSNIIKIVDSASSYSRVSETLGCIK